VVPHSELIANPSLKVTESFLNNKECFLTEEPWKKVLRTAICHDPTIPPEQSKLIYRLWSALIYGPNIFKMVTSLVMSPTPPTESEIETAVEKIQKDLTYLRMWEDLLRQQQQALQSPPAEDDVDSSNGTKFIFAAPSWSKGKNPMPWPVLRGTFMMCGMLKRRLLVSLVPSRFPHIEAEAQALANTTLERNSDPAARREDGILGGLFLAQTVWVAKAVISTKNIWYGTTADASTLMPNEDAKGPMTEQWKFKIWCKELGRKIA
jgi:hypothetical protein